MSGLPLPLAFPLGGGTTDLNRTDAVLYDIAGRLETLQLWASFDGGEDWEPLVLDGEMDQRASYGGSSRSLLAGVYRWNLRRMGGWPSRVVVFDDYGHARDTVPVSGSLGPTVSLFPGDKPVYPETLDPSRVVQVLFTPHDYAIDELSMSVWLSFDGGARWEAAVKKGELVSVYAEAGSTKTVLGGGSWVFNLERFGGLYSAQRAGTVWIKASACDIHGLIAGEVVP